MHLADLLYHYSRAQWV